jgi:integrase
MALSKSKVSKARDGAGTLVQRGDGRWMGQVRIEGRRFTVYGRTKGEAAGKLDALRKQYLVQGGLPGPQRLFELLDRWTAATEPGLRPSTVRDNRRYCALVRAELGDLPLAKLNPSRLQLLYAKLQSHPRKALHVHALVHKVLNAAVLWGWLPVNPADRVQRPAYRPKTKELWTADQCRVFLAATEGTDWWPLWVVALESGCRFGELAGLRWTDVDLDRGVLRIERSLQKVSRVWVETAPKTASGRRLVHVGGPAVRALHRQRALQAEWRLKAGSDWQDAGRVFSNRSGGPLGVGTADHALSMACKRAGVLRISMHTFRHLHASLTLQAGAPIALVSRQLGHAHVGITTSIYSHAIGDGAAVREALQRALETGT